mmetsp:Transcript_42921/g.100604  ORF Transcript_42921/g.100604 Transcript_42921/m.100604 type:complete len:222 (+) Transcript_42921:251-916(+)
MRGARAHTHACISLPPLSEAPAWRELPASQRPPSTDHNHSAMAASSQRTECTTHLGGHERLRALLRQALLKDLFRALALLVFLTLANRAVLLAEDQLDVARARHVRVGATVRTVRPPALLLRTIHLDVEDFEVLRVEALHLRIALGVLQQVQQELAALLRPAALCSVGHLRLRVPAHAPIEEAERDGLLVLNDIFQVLLRLLHLHLSDRRGSDARVLEVHA